MKKRILMLLVITLLVFSAIPVMAAESPTAAPVYNVTINGTTVGKDGASGVKVDGGKISVSTGVVKVGEKVTLTATANNGNKFVKWIIDGDYTIVSGSLTDTTITIIPNEDIDVNAQFVTTDGTTTVVEPTTKPSDNSVTSPKTGSSAGVILALLLASGVVAIVSRKKITE